MSLVTVRATLDENGELHLSEAARQRLRGLSAREVALAIEPLDNLGRQVDEIQRWLRSARRASQPWTRAAYVKGAEKLLAALWPHRPPDADTFAEVFVLLREALRLNPAERLNNSQLETFIVILERLRTLVQDEATVEAVLDELRAVNLATLPPLNIEDGSIHADELV